MGPHFLVVEDEDEDGNWTYDWSGYVEHPDDCPKSLLWEGLDGFEDVYKHDCAFEYELEHVGMEAFGPTEKERLEDWGEPPLRVEIEHIVERHPAGPWGPEEVSTWIIPKEHESET